MDIVLGRGRKTSAKPFGIGGEVPGPRVELGSPEVLVVLISHHVFSSGDAGFVHIMEARIRLQVLQDGLYLL
ncbi:hypothetical protein OV090_40960 [Nannocystis sp. RBIL2]|uniref:hypothetical protein n=1 Tax=Nannocystis sp. RBIL2 TaxID=2996788 RepID=UPI0022719B55|nr:hypothetical protein [Nannocystis sp. RBIL2]MCY1071185.1 hypothetical protein [Nannocystis sp. RBIL2]